MRLHPPSAGPKTENTKRTHFPRQPQQNKSTSHGFVGQVGNLRRVGNPPTLISEPGATPRGLSPLPPAVPWYPCAAQPVAAGDIVITRGGRPTRPDNLSMPFIRRFLLACAAAGLIFAQPAPQKQLTARELFYAAAPAPAAVKPRSEERRVGKEC